MIHHQRLNLCLIQSTYTNLELKKLQSIYFLIIKIDPFLILFQTLHSKTLFLTHINSLTIVFVWKFWSLCKLCFFLLLKIKITFYFWIILEAHLSLYFHHNY